MTPQSSGRRPLLVPAARLVLGLLGSMLLAGSVLAQSTYPSRPIRLLVPFTPGGVSDGSARIVAEGLTRQLGQNVVVENHPGAAGLLSGEMTARAEPDGYTLMLGYNGLMAINPFIFAKMPYDTLKDLAAVGKIGDYPSVLVANKSLGVKDWKAVYALSKTTPQGLFYGTSGAGSTENLIGVLLAQRTGANLVHVPYKGAGPAQADAMGGHIPLALTSLAGGLPLIQSGKLQAIAISGAVRSRSAPDIPTFIEAGVPDFVINSWVGIIAPGKTPAAIVNKLNGALNTALKTSETRDALYRLGIEATPGTAASFREEIKRDLARFGPVVQAAGLTGSQ